MSQEVEQTWKPELKAAVSRLLNPGIIISNKIFFKGKQKKSCIIYGISTHNSIRPHTIFCPALDSLSKKGQKRSHERLWQLVGLVIRLSASWQDSGLCDHDLYFRMQRVPSNKLSTHARRFSERQLNQCSILENNENVPSKDVPLSVTRKHIENLGR